MSGNFRILWQDSDGREIISRAQIVDVSGTGMKLRVEEKVPVNTYVSYNDVTLGICGRGSVRYCRFEKGKIALGIEFIGDTGRRKPSAA